MICGNCNSEVPDRSKFCLECGTSLRSLASGNDGGATAPADGAWQDGAWQGGEGEYRHLTVMFTDLVGSTRLSEQLPPEAYRRLILRYRQICIDAIGRYGGFVAKYLGDGLLAYFGYPNAYEDNAKRACYAALAIHAELERSGGEAFADSGIRIGVHSGRVLISAIGVGEARETHAVVGQAPNLAARLQEAAKANQTVISGATRKLLGTGFKVAARGRVALKGIAEPVELFDLEGIDPRSESAAGGQQIDLVERDREKDWLLDRWRGLSGFTTVALTEQAGIGKSALVDWFVARLRTENHRAFTMTCSPYEERSPFAPVRAALEHASGGELVDSALDREACYDAFLDGVGLEDENARAAIKHLADLEQAWIAKAYSSDPEGLRAQYVRAFERLLRRLLRPGPLLVVLEDAQWADPSTKEMVGQIASLLRDCPILLLTTGREAAGLRDGLEAHRLRLPPLTREAAVRLARALDGKGVLDDRDLDRIAARCDGVPLFVRELTRATIESRRSGQAAARGDEDLTPLSLADALTARLETLGPAKLVAQSASVIGRRFTLDGLTNLMQRPKDGLLDDLGRIIAAGVLEPEENAVKTAYRFRLNLIQSIAYDSLLDSQKVELHGRYLSWVESAEAPLAIEGPGRLAEHALRAQRRLDAAGYLKLAGERAAAQSSLAEAVDYLRDALTHLMACPEGGDRDRLQLSILVSLGGCLVSLAGAGAKETIAAYQSAVELCDSLPAAADHVAAYWGWWFTADNIDEMERRSDRVVSAAQAAGSDEFLMQAHHCAWGTAFQLGHHADCLAHIEDGLRLYGRAGRGEQARLFGGHDMAVCGLGEAGLTHWLTGRLSASSEQIEAALSKAEDLQHIGSRTHALDYGLTQCFYARDLVGMEHHGKGLADLATRFQLPDVSAKLEIFTGWAQTQKGQAARGLASIRSGLDVMRELGGFEDFPVYIAMEAETLLHLGQHEEAYDRLTRGREIEEAMQFRYFAAEIARLRGLAALKAGRGDAAKESFAEACEIASAQGAKMLLLRSLSTMIEHTGEALPGAPARCQLQDALKQVDPAVLSLDVQWANGLLKHSFQTVS